MAPILGGYGQNPYGFSFYGSAPEPVPITGAVSLDGYHIEVSFASAVPFGGGLSSPVLWVLTSTWGAPATVVSVTPGVTVPLGVTSVVLEHTGTTLGGLCVVSYLGVLLLGTATIFTQGDVPSVVATAPAGNQLLLSFDHDLLPAALLPPGSTTPSDLSSYVFSSTYPVDMVPQTVTHPYGGDASKVLITTLGMTSVAYNGVIGPSTALDYNGTYLPSAGTTFNATPVGTGTSVITGGSLRLGRGAGTSYGWKWTDTSGQLVPASTFRVDLSIDASVASFLPTANGQSVASLYLEDAATGLGAEVIVTLQRGVTGTDQIRLRSGAYDVTFNTDWSSGPKTITLLRNMRAGFYTLMVNQTIIASVLLANFTGISNSGPAVTVLLENGAFSVANFKISSLLTTASLTIYSDSWNFIHSLSTVIVGNPGLTRPWLQTKRGPLVKNWGDATPATKNDVTVRVNGISVPILDVNPYLGRVAPTVPIPLLPPGHPQGHVDVDYVWFQSPIMEMEGLNYPGLGLNIWNRTTGRNSETQTPCLGAVPAGQRFPMGIVLGPIARPKPLLIGHRYMGFEREYSALLNSPTSLLLNQSPFRTAIPGFVTREEPEAGNFEGTSPPVTSDPAWTLLGADAGQINNDGTYTVVDNQTGHYDPASIPATVYSRLLVAPLPSTITLTGRLQVLSSTPDGIFTGVGFGCHDNQQLYLAGALLVNGVEHVGLLTNAQRAAHVDGWNIGPSTTATLTSRSTLEMATADAPADFQDGSRFQILVGSQIGVYTVSNVVRHLDGTLHADVSPSFPVDPHYFGNKYPTIIFEAFWTGSVADNLFSTYRLTISTALKTALLTMSGRTTATVAAGSAPLPRPGESSLMFSTDDQGQVFWGSLSYLAVSSSRWSFYRYRVRPDENQARSHSKTVLSDMAVLPENETDDWFTPQSFGYSTALGSLVLLKSTSTSETLPFTFGYERIEPFLDPKANVDLTTSFLVDTGVLGAGDGLIVINDSLREVRLGTICYWEDVANDPYRQLLKMPVVSMAGMRLPTEQGWTENLAPSSYAVDGNDFVATQNLGSANEYVQVLDTSTLICPDSQERVLEATLAVDSYTVGATGIRFFMFVPAGSRLEVRLSTAPYQVQLLDETGVRASYNFDWNDGGFHTYRAVASGGFYTLSIDDAVQAPPVAHVNPGGVLCYFGAGNTAHSSVVRWRAVSFSMLPPAGAFRTFGVWKGDDKDNINNWELPRTDTSDALNSDQIGPVIEANGFWDWRNPRIELRVLRTPDWGVTVYRPDLPPPPYYVPETPGVPGTGYMNQTTEPSLGWINVEYPNLPKVRRTFGSISFGALDARSVTQQVWDYVRYRLFQPDPVGYKAPQHMVLNQANVITSGERNIAVEQETVVIQVVDNRRVTLKPIHIYAQDIYKVVDGSTIYTRESWDWDADAQLITLKTATFVNTTVTVVFTAGKPVTNTYLLRQPVLDSVTLLNEGTPPVPRSQVGPSIMVIDGDPEELVYEDYPRVPITGVNIGTGVFTVAGNQNTDLILDGKLTVLGSTGNDGTYTILTRVQVGGNTEFTVEETIPDGTVDGTLTWKNSRLYENLSFMQVTDGGSQRLIRSIGEGFIPPGETGWMSGEGEPVYSPAGTGAPLGGVGDCAGLNATGGFVGAPAAGSAWWFKGTKYSEPGPRMWPGVLDQLGGMPGSFLIACGGVNMMGPTVDGTGKINGDAPQGGLLNQTQLYANFPSTPLEVHTVSIWDDGSSDWDAGGTFWDSTSLLLPQPDSVATNMQTEWDLRITFQDRLVFANPSTIWFDLIDAFTLLPIISWTDIS